MPDLEASVQARDARISTLTGVLEGRDSQLERVQAALTMSEGDIGRYNARISGLEANLKDRAIKLKTQDVEIGNLNTQIVHLSNRLSEDSAEIDALNADLSKKDAEIEELRQQIPAISRGVGATLATGVPAVASDDLKRIWGIGPKIEQILNERGIDTFAELAEASLEQINAILSQSGSHFNMSTDKLHVNWRRQARLAARGDWDGFQKLYDELSWKKIRDDN